MPKKNRSGCSPRVAIGIVLCLGLTTYGIYYQIKDSLVGVIALNLLDGAGQNPSFGAKRVHHIAEREMTQQNRVVRKAAIQIDMKAAVKQARAVKGVMISDSQRL